MDELREETILGLDNLPLDLPIAGAGSRALAAFLDYLIVGGVALIFSILFFLAAVRLRVGAWWFALLIFGYFAIEYGYFALVEILTGGRSFGKWAVGLRVATRLGGRPGVAALLIRNCVRSVDLIVGIPLMASDALARRLGDRLAGTVVVHTRVREPEVVLNCIPKGWGSGEVALLEAFLRRAEGLDPERSQAMGRELLACIERDDPVLFAAVTPSGDAVETLRRVLRPGPV
jgi:uncharacterized RDD family membrane protein YckC